MLFGKTLRKMREKRSLSREELAVEVHHSASTIANIETGYRAPTPEQAKDFDKFFDLPGMFQDLEERLHGLPFSAGFRPFAPFEAEAVVLKIFDCTTVPGLLQTEAYAREVLSTHPDVTPELIEERLKGRMDRQKILGRESPPAPRLWVLLDEMVLRRAVGGPKVMAEQIQRLIDVASSPGVTIQIIDAAAHCGLSGAVIIAELPARRVAYLETIGDGMTVEDFRDAELKFDTLRTEALRGSESLALMERIRDEWTQN